MKCIILILFSVLNMHITKVLFEINDMKFTSVLLASTAISLLIYHVLFYIYKSHPYDKYFFSAAYGISWLLPVLTSQYSIAILPFLLYNHFIYCMFVCEEHFKKPNFILLFVSAIYAIWSFLLYVRIGFDTYLFFNVIPSIIYAFYVYHKKFDNKVLLLERHFI